GTPRASCAAGQAGTARRSGLAGRDVHPRRDRTAPAARHTPYSRNEIVVTYGLIGMLDPSDSRIPPTTDTVAKAALSTGTSTGDAVTRTAAAAGVHSSASTSSAPTICTDTATARPSTSMKIGDSARTGTPRAAATSGSRLANVSGRHMTARQTRTTAEVPSSQD